jgi:hypothetical protein
MYGEPVEQVPCEACRGTDEVLSGAGDLLARRDKHGIVEGCGVCMGRRVTERRLPCLGEGFNAVRSREVYPRHLRRDGGGLWERSVELSRTEVQDFKQDVERLAGKLGAAFESWEFPAVGGSHCAQCACEAECPLPPQLRNHAGAINTEDQAAEVAEAWERTKAQVSAVQKELRRFASAHGPIRYGRDRVLDFAEQESRSVDYEGLQAAAWEAAQYGTPFRFEDFVSVKTSNRFSPRTLTAAELGEDEPEQSLDEKYGETAPW